MNSKCIHGFGVALIHGTHLNNSSNGFVSDVFSIKSMHIFRKSVVKLLNDAISKQSHQNT